MDCNALWLHLGYPVKDSVAYVWMNWETSSSCLFRLLESGNHEFGDIFLIFHLPFYFQKMGRSLCRLFQRGSLPTVKRPSMIDLSFHHRQPGRLSSSRRSADERTDPGRFSCVIYSVAFGH